MTEQETEKLADALYRRIEPKLHSSLRSHVESIHYDMLQHLGQEMENYAKMIKQGGV